MTTKLGVVHVVKREVTLTPDELEDKKDAVLALLKRRDEAESTRKEDNKRKKQAIDGMSASISQLARAVEVGIEEVEVSVVWERTPDGEGAQLVDVKNRERVLERRALEPGEKQIDIRDIIKEPNGEQHEQAQAGQTDAASTSPQQDGAGAERAPAGAAGAAEPDPATDIIARLEGTSDMQASQDDGPRHNL